MPDYAGAEAAIRARLVANWTVTPISFMNEQEPVKVDAQQKTKPWVALEIICTGSEIVGFGTPGQQTIRYEGLINLHVVVPLNTSDTIATQHAIALGEIFRNDFFYNGTPGYYVRSLSPRISAGVGGSEDGLWFRKTCIVPFEYWHRG
ncbi:MAG: hypothetical protein AB7P16_23500 [Bradyrhizobium sp.]|uniref:hypothetical protein n=1 Tax=Bradyrhizobium sp. TaxID=376 RepID=UPI003D0D3B7B